MLNVVKALTADVPSLESTSNAPPSATDATRSTAAPAGTDSGNTASSGTIDNGSTWAIGGVVLLALALSGIGGYIALRRRRNS